MRKSIFRYFTRGELALWGVSVLLITAAFLVFDRKDVLTLCASLVGITSLIFNAKGNPIGQLLIVLFSILYGIISYRSAYYGEMITYLGMTAPIAVAAPSLPQRTPQTTPCSSCYGRLPRKAIRAACRSLCASPCSSSVTCTDLSAGSGGCACKTRTL